MGMKTLLAGSLAMSMNLAAASDDGLRCAMSLPMTLKAGEPAELRWRLSNTGTQALAVLGWATPLEGVFAAFLELSRDGQILPFSGPMMKRGDPEDGDYLSLKPGQSEEAVVDLATAWPVAAPGRYRLRYTGGLLDVALAGAPLPRARDAWQGRALDCPELQFTRLP